MVVQLRPSETVHQDPYVAMMDMLKKKQQVSDVPNGDVKSSDDASTPQPMPATATATKELQWSWMDPQIHLKTAAGKNQTTYHDVTDFVITAGGGSVEEVISECGDARVFVKSGPAKPKLQSLSKAQWSLANLAILNRLVNDCELDKQGMLDYMSHTAYMYRLMLSKEKVSVFQYDREYRREQAQHQFRWGTHASHLNDVCLRPKGAKRQQKQHTVTRPTGPKTSAGKIICKRFNTSTGCTLAECKFLHVCSVPSCEKPHPSTLHSQYV